MLVNMLVIVILFWDINLDRDLNWSFSCEMWIYVW